MDEEFAFLEAIIVSDIDVIINATSLGLKKNDKFQIDFSKAGNGKLFYDVIYEPFETEFSKSARETGNIYENGLNMFLYQAQKAFNIWHKVEPEVNSKVTEFLKSQNL